MSSTSTSPRRSATRVGLPRPTGTAWGLMLLGLGLLGAAINTGNNLLYLLFGLLMATLPVSMYVSLLNLLRLEISIRLPPQPRASVPFRIEVIARNRRRFLAARALRLVVVTRRGEHGPALLESVPAGQSGRVALSVLHARRGPQQLLGVRVVTTFPFGLLARRRFYPRPDELLVMPAPAFLSARDRRAHGESGEAGRTVRADGIEYEGLRRGREQDDARRVDWKATARSGTLMVRETSGEGRPILEMSLGTRRTEEPPMAARISFEKDVSRVAGRALPVLRAGGIVKLTVDGEKRTFSGPGSWSGMSRLLARLVPTDRAGQLLPPLPRPPRVDRTAGLRDLPPGRVHGHSSLVALAVSATALFAYGGIGPVGFGLLVVALGAAVFTRLPAMLQRSGLQLIWRVAAVGALVFYVIDLVVLRHNPLSASLALIVFITLYKLFNARSLSDDRQLLLVSLLQMVLAAALTTGVSFVVPLVVWLLAVTHAQIAWTSLPAAAGDASRPALFLTSPSRPRYAWPAAGLTGALLACGALAFVLVPHLGTGAFALGALRTSAVSGFSETTRLGDIGRIKLNSARVMDIELPEGVPPGVELKWRGLVLDRFDGRTWSRSDQGISWLAGDLDGWFATGGPGRGAAEQRPGSILRQHIRLQPGNGRVLFAVARPESVSTPDLNFLARDFAGSLLFPQPLRRRIAYEVASRLPRDSPDLLRSAAGEDPVPLRRRYLDLPELDPRIPALAERITAGAPTRYDAAARLETWLCTNRRYSLRVDDMGVADPLARFLLDEMPAHCEYFASSMVVLARAVGIPSRYVAGYLRGEKNRFSQRYTVRQSDAHAWVEVHFPGPGWVAFDPTPPAGRGDWEEQGLIDLAGDVYSTLARWWDDYVIGIDLDDQVRAFLVLRDAAGRGLEGLAALGALGWRGGVLLLTPLSVLVASLLWWRGWTPVSGWRPLGGRGDRGRVPPPFYRRLVAMLRRRDLERRPGETPAEFAARAAAVLPVRAAERVRDLTHLYYRLRFDAGADLRGGRRLGQRLLKDVRRELGLARSRVVASG